MNGKLLLFRGGGGGCRALNFVNFVGFVVIAKTSDLFWSLTYDEKGNQMVSKENLRIGRQMLKIITILFRRKESSWWVKAKEILGETDLEESGSTCFLIRHFQLFLLFQDPSGLNSILQPITTSPDFRH